MYFQILIGVVERNLFTRESTTGDRTFLASDGNYYTGVETYEGAYACATDDGCLAAVVAASIGDDITAESVEGSADVAYVTTDSNGGFVDATAYEREDGYVAETNEDYIACDHCGRILDGEPAADYVTTAVDAYVTAALWSTVGTEPGDDDGDDPRPLDEDHGPDDIDADTLAEMRADVLAFIGDNWRDVASMDPAQIGHDFWLTREGHGAGFWDRGDGERGERLSAACKPYGGFGLYIGDDGLIYG